MTRPHHDLAIARLLGPAEPEILCGECFEQLDVYVDAEAWKGFADAAERPDIAVERRELLGAIGECIGGELTPHQREVLVALAIDGVPIDVLAERLATTRGALYKTLHDARRRLRGRLAERGLGSEVS